MPDSPKRDRAGKHVPDDDHPADVAADAYEALQRRLADSLVMLRAEFREAVESYSVRVQGMVTRAADALAEDPAALSEAQRRARSSLLRQALKDLDGLGVKPAKGRRKDLKRIEKFVDDLCDSVAEW